MAETTEQRLRTIFAEHLGVEEEKVTLDARLRDDLNADSLDRLELVMAVEEEFQINVTDQEAERLNTFGDVVRKVEERIG